MLCVMMIWRTRIEKGVKLPVIVEYELWFYTLAFDFVWNHFDRQEENVSHCCTWLMLSQC